MELDKGQHDVVLITEAWRSELEEKLISPKGGLLYLSGGSTHHGVGIYISSAMRKQISNICFHAVSARVCMLQFCMRERRFHVFSCYMPTAWDSYGQVELVYDILDLLLFVACAHSRDVSHLHSGR